MKRLQAVSGRPRLARVGTMRSALSGVCSGFESRTMPNV